MISKRGVKNVLVRRIQARWVDNQNLMTNKRGVEKGVGEEDPSLELQLAFNKALAATIFENYQCVWELHEWIF